MPEEKRVEERVDYKTRLPISLSEDKRKLVYGDTTYDKYYVYPHEYGTIQDYIDIYNSDGKIKKAIDLPVEKALNNISDYHHKDARVSEFIRNEVFSDVKYKSWLFNIMSARYIGVSVSLVVPYYSKGKLLIDEVYTINPLWYIPNSGIGETKIRFNYSGVVNKEIARNKLIVYTHDPQFTDPYGTSMIEAIKKDYEEMCLVDYAYKLYLRKFGSPGLFLHMPKEISDANRDDWSNNLEGIVAGGHVVARDMVKNTAGKYEPTSILDVIEVNKGTADYQEYVGRKDRDIMTGLGVPSILFNTNESGSYSLGAIHKEMFNLTVQRCQNAIQAVFCHQIAEPLIEANFGITERGQLIFQDVEGRAFKELTQSVGVATSSGWLSPMIPSHVDKVNKILGLESDPKETAELVKINREKAESEKQNNQPNEIGITGRENANSARFAHGEQIRGKVGGLNPKGENNEN